MSMSRIPIHNCAAWGVRRRHRDGEAHPTGTTAEWLPCPINWRYRRRCRTANPPTDLKTRPGYDGSASGLLASKALKELSAAHATRVTSSEDFFGGGNVSIAFQYQDAVTERLFSAAPRTSLPCTGCPLADHPQSWLADLRMHQNRRSLRDHANGQG